MKLTKTLMMLAVALVASHGAFAVDSYLYWMASANIENQISHALVDWDYATVKYGSGDSYLTLSAYDGGMNLGYALDYEDAIKAGSWWGVFNYTAGSEFLFELWNDNGSDPATLAGYVSLPWSALTDSIGGGTDKPASGGAFTLTGVVPEPTSGLLSLFGLAALALRRRRRA